MQCRTWIRIRNSRLKWFTFLLELKKRIRVHWSELCRYFGSKIFPTYQSVTEISTAISTKSDWQVSLGKLFSISGCRIADVSLTPILLQLFQHSHRPLGLLQSPQKYSLTAKKNSSGLYETECSSLTLVIYSLFFVCLFVVFQALFSQLLKLCGNINNLCL